MTVQDLNTWKGRAATMHDWVNELQGLYGPEKLERLKHCLHIVQSEAENVMGQPAGTLNPGGVPKPSSSQGGTPPAPPS